MESRRTRDYVKDEGVREMSEVTITIRPKGPYTVIGDFKIIDANGNELEKKEKVSLCRCGAATWWAIIR